jgi:hypothetical protein
MVTPYSRLLERRSICESVAGGKVVCPMKRRLSERNVMRIAMSIRST